jgi:predicted metalloprotease with PDZ domain
MRKLFYLFALQFGACYAFGQKINYEVSFPNLLHHEADISVTVTNAAQKDLTFRMSRSSPGRYATHEFGKNIYNVKAFDNAGAALKVQRLDGDVYKVAAANGIVKVQYTLYANHPDGTYAGLDINSVHLNMPATFMWVTELQNAPIEVKFNLPQDVKWSIGTQLKPTSQANTFTAPGLQYFMDSPVKIGKLTMREWTLQNPDKKPAKFRLALEITQSDSLADSFASKVKRVTQETQMVFVNFRCLIMVNIRFWRALILM